MPRPTSPRRSLVAVLLGAAALLLVTASAAAGATSSISFAADPTEEIATTITVSGSADVATRLFVYVSSGTGSCTATASANWGTVLTAYNGDATAAGAYTRQFDYTPQDSGAYRVCAYLSTTPSSTPQATASNLLSVREPSATVGVADSADATEELPITYTVSGSTEVDRRLFVYAGKGGDSCTATASANWGTVLSAYNGDAIAAGSFTRTYSYTPQDSGSVRVCAYVAESSADLPHATADQLTAVREPTASLSLALSAAPVKGQPLTVLASGATERDRRLFLYLASRSSTCAATATGSAGSTLTAYNGDAIAAGQLSRGYSFTPPSDGPHVLCGYLAETSGDTPNGAAALPFTVVDPNAPKLGIGAPAVAGANDAVPLTFFGTMPTASQLTAFVGPEGTACAPTSARQAATSGVRTVRPPQALAAGGISSGATFGPAQPGRYRVCAYLYVDDEDEGVDLAARPAVSATTVFEIGRDPAVVPQLLTGDGAAVRDRVTVSWRRGARGETDLVTLYDAPPSSGGRVLWSGDVRANGVRVTRRGDAISAQVLREFGYRTLWWTVDRPGPYGGSYRSEARSIRIVPRPLSPSAVRASVSAAPPRSSRARGRVRLTIVSSPRARVRLVVRRGSRTVQRRSYVEGASARRTLTFATSCAAPGRYTFVVAISDPYGTTASQRGSWAVSGARCSRMRAEERRRAARR